MAAIDLFSLREVFLGQGVLICFNGPFSHSVIEELGTAVRKYLEGADAPTTRIADVFAVFIEEAQNLKNYTSRTTGDSGPPSHRTGTLVIAREADRYVVSSGNMVRKTDIGGVIERLEAIAKLDKAQLKSAYKERLRSPQAAGGGAGLGLIDIARRTSEPLRFSVQEIDEQSVFFSISAVI